MDESLATKADLAEVKAELKADIAQLTVDLSQLRAETHHGYDDLKETMRDMQTEMLKAFYSCRLTPPCSSALPW